MTKNEIQEIFDIKGLGKVQTIKKSTIGFSNTIQFINTNFVLKSSQEHRNKLSKESDLLKFYESSLPVPRVIYSDFSKNKFNCDFILMDLIGGKSVYQIWSETCPDNRKEIIKRITDYLKTINNSRISSLNKYFDIPNSWKSFMQDKFKKVLLKQRELHIFESQLLDELENYFHNNVFVFDEEVIKPTYWDVHFDNFITRDSKVIGVIDLESVEYLSIDYALLSIKRMSEIPKEYASEEFEAKVVDSDYKEIYAYFKEFYPQAFNFKYIDKRIDIYSIIYDLEILLRFPKAQDRIERVQNDINKLIS